MPDAIVLADEKRKLFTALSGYAGALSTLTDEQVPEAFEMTAKLGELADEVRTRLRERVLNRVLAEGEVITDKGSKGMRVAGYKLGCIPTRTGIDPKKLEALLRHKKLEPAVAMDSTVTWSVNNNKVMASVKEGRLTAADVESCRYAPAWRVSVEKSDE